MAQAKRPILSKLTCGVIAAVVLLVLIGGVVIYFNIYQGRNISRFTGIAVKISLPECITNPDQIISVSFHKNANGETIKDLTYRCNDGKIFSQEYNDLGILQGSIEWQYKPAAASQP